MTRFSEADGRRVITRDTARQIGSVKRYLLDPATASVLAIQIGDKSGQPQIVDWPSILAFGEDAVIVESEGVAREVSGEREERFIKGTEDLKDKRVLTDQGDELGSVRDVVFDARTGRLSQFVLREQELPIERLVAVGPYAVIVPAPAADARP